MRTINGVFAKRNNKNKQTKKSKTKKRQKRRKKDQKTAKMKTTTKSNSHPNTEFSKSTLFTVIE